MEGDDSACEPRPQATGAPNACKLADSSPTWPLDPQAGDKYVRAGDKANYDLHSIGPARAVVTAGWAGITLEVCSGSAGLTCALN